VLLIRHEVGVEVVGWQDSEISMNAEAKDLALGMQFYANIGRDLT
jgi:hypothetical protein